MDLISKLIKRSRTCKRIVRLALSEFQQVVKKVTPSFKKSISTKKSGRPNGIKGLENQLLCLLIYYRTYTTELFMGLVFQVDARLRCSCTIKHLAPLLAVKIKIKKDRKMSEGSLHTLMVDCTEQPIRPPKNTSYVQIKNGTFRCYISNIGTVKKL